VHCDLSHINHTFLSSLYQCYDMDDNAGGKAIVCKENRAKMSKNECIVELVVRDGERNVDGNSGGVLLPNSVCMS
jgi:hypothetical protein